MYLSQLNLWNFRKYAIKGESFEESDPGLSVSFEDGLNVLVGENDSGKTAIIDAIRYVLKTQSLEFIRIEEKDFYKDEKKGRTYELRIECIFSGFTDQEAANFLEWIGFNEEGEYQLKIWLYAKRKDYKVYPTIRAGFDSQGSYLEGEARDLLRVTYLKPLRDALNELSAGWNSRLSQIFKSHPVFKKTNKDDKHELEDIFERAGTKVKNYFKDKDGKTLLETINKTFLKKFLLSGDDRESDIIITENELTEILKRLSLLLEDNKSGLGTLNLLFIATELLHLERDTTGLKLTLIEELEAHLHPQFQLRLIDFIQKNDQYGQFILTTHSTTLASKLQLENLIICKGEKVYPMGNQHTQLHKGDYGFLERFLDATKANMFFAKGVILVEGDAEHLLLPTFAEIIGRPLHDYGVSLVNIGNTAFKRYAGIYLRKPIKGEEVSEEDYFDIPVAIITDTDVKYEEGAEDLKEERREGKRNELKEKYNAQKVTVHAPLKWTLEYDLAMSSIKKELFQAIYVAKKLKNNDDLEVNEDLLEKSETEAKQFLEDTDKTEWQDEKLANEIYEPLKKGNASKAVTAQVLASILANRREAVKETILSDEHLKYLRDAIEYVTAPINKEDSDET